MSNVPKHERKESSFQVVATSEDIFKSAVEICIKIPKRYQYMIGQRFIDLAFDVSTYVKQANSVFPQNQYEASIRREYYVRAYATIQALISITNMIIDIAIKHGVAKSFIDGLLKLERDEMRLIKGSMDSDKNRFSNLK